MLRSTTHYHSSCVTAHVNTGLFVVAKERYFEIAKTKYDAQEVAVITAWYYVDVLGDAHK